MPSRDPRVDAYIAKSADFAKPILAHLRQLVHAADPKIEETIKWGMPHFMGRGIICNLAAFKHHCAFGFWNRKLVLGNAADGAGEEAMGQFGRITSKGDLPADKVLLGYIRKAVELDQAGVKKPAAPKSAIKKELVVPDDLRAALRKNKKALTFFESFSYSHKREYLEWITDAKREETRQRRVAKTIEQLVAGHSLNWKYERC